MGSHACLNPARTRRAWRVTHASIQHVHTDLSRCGGWLQKAVPLPAQSSHLCVNQQVWRFALTRRLALSARTLVAPACRLCMWCAVQSGSGTPAHWHHVRRELDRTRRLGPTRPIREWHSCYTGIMFAANLIGPGDSDRLGHSMCRGVSTTPSARRTAHTRTPCVMHAVQQQCSATRHVTPTSGMTPVWGVTHDSTQGAAGNHG